MKTRHLTAIIKNGEYKLAQYGNCEFYGVSSPGELVLKFLIENYSQLNNLYKLVDNLSWISNEEFNKICYDCGYDENDEFNDKFFLKNLKLKYPEFSRDTGAYILKLVFERGVRKLRNDIGFAELSLLCEWAYIIDFDKKTYEIYKGLNTKKLTKNARFYHLKTNEVYQPVKKIKTYSLYNLPTVEQFNNKISKYL